MRSRFPALYQQPPGDFGGKVVHNITDAMASLLGDDLKVISCISNTMNSFEHYGKDTEMAVHLVTGNEVVASETLFLLSIFSHCSIASE